LAIFGVSLVLGLAFFTNSESDQSIQSVVSSEDTKFDSATESRFFSSSIASGTLAFAIEPEDQVIEPEGQVIETGRRDIALPMTSKVATANASFVKSYTEPDLESQPGPGFVNPTQFDGVRVFQILDDSNPEFVKVSLPKKPNGQTGWIQRTEVEVTQIDYKALVDLQSNTLTVWAGEEIVVDTKAVTGAPRTPTPVGTFFVRDIIKKDYAGGGYGPYILALSGFSETLETFNGGLPAIAIHGTNNQNLFGQYRSNGCVRIPNDLVTQLATSVPLGTPVTIVA